MKSMEKLARQGFDQGWRKAREDPHGLELIGDSGNSRIEAQMRVAWSASRGRFVKWYFDQLREKWFPVNVSPAEALALRAEVRRASGRSAEAAFGQVEQGSSA